MEVFALDDVDIILLGIFGILFIIQLFYYLGIYNKINSRHKAVLKNKVNFTEEQPPVSIIIYGENDSESLNNNLPRILEQDYPEFEVIVVNDGVTVESDGVFARLERNYPNFYHTFVPEGSRYVSRKKLALTMGIKASKYDWLVFTDFDCYPAENNWLKTLARNFTEDTGIVLGYSSYDTKKGFSIRKINFSNLFNSMRYLGYALMKKPYMGIGRNMAYRKNMFFNNKGFSSFLNLQRGEDDLFINEVATRTNTRVEVSKDALVYVHPYSVKKHWKESRLNYFVTSQYYKGKQKYGLGFETFTRILFYGVLIAGIVKAILTANWILLAILLSVFIFRFIIQLYVINKTAVLLGEKRYYFLLVGFDILLPFNTLYYKIVRRFRRRKNFVSK